MKPRKTVVSVHAWLPSYRLDFYNALSTRGNYSVTVVHAGVPVGNQVCEQYGVSEIVLPTWNLGGFRILRGLDKQLTGADAIIFLLDPRWVDGFKACLPKYRPRSLFWGIGAGKSFPMNLLRRFMARNTRTLFYSEQGMQNLGFQLSEYHRVAPNTVAVQKSRRNELAPGGRHILAIGTLDARKEIDKSLREFRQAIPRLPCDVQLWIVGEGTLRSQIEGQIQDYGLQGRVQMLGKIHDTQKLREVYSSGAVSLSYGQAGLSVLQSLGHGVPFLTKVNAVSGGEIHNVITGETGFLFQDAPGVLCNLLVQLYLNPNRIKDLHQSSQEYYLNHRTMDRMVEPFIELIDANHFSFKR